MGSRLGVIVQTESGSEIYYDHWAAQSIGGVARIKQNGILGQLLRDSWLAFTEGLL